ncbi:MAG: cellulase family glycosylhydrolase, partial [Chloroflexi bacterium]|nr:cellulase family glycosylhydrolase [Chloroflexota bacterium]
MNKAKLWLPTFFKPFRPSLPRLCVTQSAGGYTFAFLGYRGNGDGTTTLTFRVTNTNKQDVSHIAFGTGNWTRMAPTDTMTVTNSLGAYLVVWTNTNGEPGFPSFKFQPQFSGFSQGASDTFNFTVAHFDPTTPLTLQAKAGTTRTPVTLALNSPACNLTAPPPTPVSPLPTPTATPTTAFPNTEVYVLSASLLASPLSAADKAARWRQGLPVPLATIDTSLEQPAHPRQDHASEAEAVQAAAVTLTATPVAVDNWRERDRENVEPATPKDNPFPNNTGDCAWSFTQKAGVKQKYIWGAGIDRTMSPSHALWPAGAVNKNAPPSTQPLPPNTPYPADMITGVICKLAVPANTDNVLAEFQMWFELADAGDSLSVQFYSGNNSDAPVYRGGLEWRGSTSGKVARDWSLYRLYYPGLAKNTNTVWVQWQFSSDTNDNPAKGPWLDDLAISSYQKPTSQVSCETINPTFATNQSKGLVLPPYAEDIKNGAPDQIAAMIGRLQTAGVNWVRLEFRVNPSSFTNPATDPLNPLTSAYNHVDLRHYDRLIDSLCANNIAVLGLVDNQTMVRQDWQGGGVLPPNFVQDFKDTVTQLVQYFDDRIGHWEIWNEPDYDKSRLKGDQYASLLRDIFNAIRAVQPNDKVLFGGLGGVDRNAMTYFGTVLDKIQANPIPFDLFALHPYPSGEYNKVDGRVELEPGYYLRGEIEARPGTILTKFRQTLDDTTFFPPNQTGKPIWATELGWNSAKGKMTCSNYLDLVTTQ